VRTFCGQGGEVFNADVRTFESKKTPDFLKFMVCPLRQERGG